LKIFIVTLEKEKQQMIKSNQSLHKKIFTSLFALIILFSLVGFDQPPQTTCPECGCGDIPLEEETYQQYLKPVYSDTAIRQTLPSSYDARNDGIVTPAKNQGSCGGCWSFASVGAMESHLLKDGLPFSPTDLSEQQMISCHTGMSGYCGGNVLAPQYWETKGPVYDSCYPFGDSGWDGTKCPGPPTSDVACSTSCPELGYRVVNFYTVSSSEFKESLYEHGPSYFRYTVWSDFYDFYRDADPGTVYRQTSGTSRGGHAVLIIGWDDAKGAYLLKNSWGSTSGPQGDGTFWMAYSGHANDLGFNMSNFEVSAPNQAPTNITLSKSSVLEGQPINTVVGSFATVDPNSGDTHAYALVSGTGSTDNAAFNISGNQLRTSQIFEKAVKDTYAIRVRTTDQGSLYFEKQFTITVTDTSSGVQIHLPLIINGAGSQTYPLRNGDFEAGRDGSWNEYSNLGEPIIVQFEPGSVHSGVWAAWMGGLHNSVDSLSQTVTIPTTTPYLHFWYWISSEDACGYDFARIKIGNTSVAYAELCSDNNSSNWTHAAIPLDSFKGNTVNLIFEVTTDSSFLSSFYLDDVALSSSDVASPPGQTEQENPPGLPFGK
jgi:C1A family cysteine protease